MTCEICLSECAVCQNGRLRPVWASRGQPHMLEHSMMLSGVAWRCRQNHRMDADPVAVMTASGAKRLL